MLESTGIPGYPCYRTVEETFATAESIVANYPAIATWTDEEDSWERENQLGGYDIKVLQLTNSAIAGPKPKIFLRCYGALSYRHYSSNSTPVVARITDVTSTNFDVYLQNPSGGGVSTESVSYIVVEKGTWTIDGVKIEAQKYLSTVTDENNNWVGEARTYGQSYTRSVVIGQVMSDNDPDWSVFWRQGASRTSPPSASTLRTGKNRV